MKMNGETRLLLVMALFVILGGAGMFALNRLGSAPAPPPPPEPAPADWTPALFKSTLASARHMRGDTKDANFTVIEFGDLQCPSCRRAYNTYLVKVEPIVPIRFAFIHFPLNKHADAIPAAVATEAADRQGKFWPMFDTLYTGEEPNLTPAAFDAAAKRIGLDLNRFHADCADPKLTKLVRQDQALAVSDQVSETPTFVVRDEKSGVIYRAVGAGALDTFIAHESHTSPLLPPPGITSN